MSYSSADRAFVQGLAVALERHRIDVWWDKERLTVGASLSAGIRDAIAESRWFGLVLSPRTFGSEWVEMELGEAMSREHQRGEPLLLPLLIEDCDVPATVADRAHADFRTSFEDGLEQVLRSVGSPYRRAVLEALCSESPSRIRSTWSSIGAHDRSWWVSRIIEILDDVDDPRRASAITALRYMGSTDLRSRLPVLLRDSSPSVLQRALAAVAASNERMLGPAVLALQSHGDPSVRQAARAAASQLSL